ncbi:TonB-dependent receptor domain-containing protein [Paludibaculum fermentans]|uniref:TonB-dependent receptor n=1 Tax=Paludibaculum fermentans TaxID=1473598 RepID=UPI003EBF86BE
MRTQRVSSGVGILLSIAITSFLLFAVNSSLASAQVLYGSIVGSITDQSSAAVVKGAVTVTNTSTGLTVQAFTDQSGYFAVQNLMEGSYDLSITAPGFKTVTQKGVAVRINNVTRTDLRLEVGGVAESITVAASEATLQTSKADVNTNLESRAIGNLPLSGYRNYQTLMNLVPGATPVQFQNAVIDTPQRDLSTNINGQERGANNTRVDGAANILVTMPHHMVYVPPVESIEEVNISTNNFDADQGMTGGAAVTVATKTGTNSFHGSAFGFNANNVTRAMLWDENRTGTTKKPNGNRNIVGGSVGGPVKRGKLFFFTDWEGTFERVGRSSLFSVPTDDFRAGDFSRKLGSQILDAQGRQIMVPTTEGGQTALREGMVFDPYSGSPDGTGRSVFSSGGRLNVIPGSRFNAPMQKLLALVPHANQAGDLSNYFNQGTQRLNRNNLDAKINWNRSAKNQIWGKYSVMNALVHGDFGLGAAGGGCLCDGGVGDGHTLVQLAAIGQTYTVTPTFLIDGTVGWTRFGQNVQSPDLGTNFGLDVLGIPGTNGPDPKESGMPAFYVSDYSGLGNTEGWNPLYRNDQSITLNTNASWMKGKHDIRFGFEFLHHLMNHWQPELGEGPRGAFYFGSGLTALNPSALEQTVGFQNGAPSFEETWNGMGAFLLGASNEAGKSSQFIKMNSMENVYALYVRDRWRVSPKLTLSLGLRWELYPTRTRSAGMGVESYDPTTNEVLVGGYGGVPRDAGVGFSKKLFAPRVGLAYQVANNTVIRSGYGITYHSHPWGAQALRGWYPLTLVSVFDGVNGYQPVTTDPNYVKAGVPNQPLGPNVGIIPICCPDISKGRIPLPSSDEMGYPVANEQMKRGYIQSWNFIVEHKLPGEFLASLGYVGTASVNGFAFLDINASQIPGSGNDGRVLYQRFGRTATTREWNGRTHSNYHSMQMSVNRRLTGGLLIKGAYTYSHAIDEASYSDWTAFSWNALSVLDRNRANSNFNIPHMFQVGYMYELPFGKTKKWATGGVAAAVLGDWQFNGLFAAYQGRQYTVTASGSSLNMPGNLQTADLAKPNVDKLGLVGDDGTWFDTTAFSRPTGARFGTVGRNTMRGPGVINADLSLYRTFKITEAVNVQFRGESFNLSNTPHFANPNSNANSSNFGRILATQSGDAMGRSREFRFGLRVGF